MKKSFLIGIPIRDFKNPMSRLSQILTVEQRIELSKNLIINLHNVFNTGETSVYVISNDPQVESFCVTNGIGCFVSTQKGLNKEVTDFLECNSDYKFWSIVHGDLPYITKYFANIWIQLCKSKESVIAESKDMGTPIFGGNKRLNVFSYGEKSFIRHTDMLKEKSIIYERVFHKEFYFELDDEDDYLEFIKHPPRWYKKINIT